MLLLILGSLIFSVRGYRDQVTTLQSFDFKPVYGGARCLIDHCNPYDETQIRSEFVAHGGNPNDLRPFRPFNANYPPSSLFLVIPFALLPFGPAHILWLGVSGFVYILAAFLIADLCAPFSPVIAVAFLASMVASSTLLLMLAQPAALVIGLCIVGVWCLLRDKLPVVAVPAFALSLTLKPHLGGLVWLYFFLANNRYRLRAIQIAIVTVIFCLPGILLASVSPASSHWLTDLHTNLIGIAAHGNASDPGPSNGEASAITSLQTIASLIRDEPAFYNAVAAGVSLVLLMAWCYPVLKMRASLEKDFMAIASVACLALLPIYHRQYDVGLLLLTFPALALLLATRRSLRLVALLLSALTIVTNFNRFHVAASRILLHGHTVGMVATVLLFRTTPVILLAQCIFYLACFYSAMRNSHTNRQSLRNLA